MSRLLIVINMLNDFCNKRGVLATSPITGKMYAKPIINPVKEVIDEARSNRNFIAWLVDAHTENDKEFDRFPVHAIKETWGSQIINELNPELINESIPETLIEKTRYSGFYNTSLNSLLKITVPAEVIVLGVCTSICIMDTVSGLANRDYNTVIMKDCVADFDPEAHKSALARMEGLYGAKIV